MNTCERQHEFSFANNRAGRWWLDTESDLGNVAERRRVTRSSLAPVFLFRRKSSDREQGQEVAAAAAPPSWTHKHKEQMRRGPSGYNPSHRNPQFAGAERAPLWELHCLTKHFHPTVSLYAKQLAANDANLLSASGDPLSDHALIKWERIAAWKLPVR